MNKSISYIDIFIRATYIDTYSIIYLSSVAIATFVVMLELVTYMSDVISI